MEANLEKVEVDALGVIANAKWGFAAVLASDILKFFYFTSSSLKIISNYQLDIRCFFAFSLEKQKIQRTTLLKITLYYPTLPNMNPIEGRYAQPSNNSSAIFNKESVLIGAPNPAINWVDLYYELPEDIKVGQLVVTSTTGATIAQIELQNNSGQINLNTKGWVSGIYFAVLFSEGQEAKVFKIVIQK